MFHTEKTGSDGESVTCCFEVPAHHGNIVPIVAVPLLLITYRMESATKETALRDHILIII